MKDGACIDETKAAVRLRGLCALANLQVVVLVAVYGEHGGVARVLGDGAGAELNDGRGGKQQEAGVEKHTAKASQTVTHGLGWVGGEGGGEHDGGKPVHHRAADFERVDGDEEEHAHADLDAALDGGPQQVE